MRNVGLSCGERLAFCSGLSVEVSFHDSPGPGLTSSNTNHTLDTPIQYQPTTIIVRFFSTLSDTISADRHL